MIQRIQSIYLLIATVLMALTCFQPLAFFSCDQGVFDLFATGLKSSDGEVVHSAIYLLIITALSAILPLVTIFLFKNRMLQIRLCVVEMVLTIGVLLMIGAYFYLAQRGIREFEFNSMGVHYAIIFPVVSLIFNYLAFKAIFKDEMLIKSLDRLR